MRPPRELMDWTDVGGVDDYPAGEAREVIVKDRIVAIYHVAGEFYALDGICPHQGGPLGRGALSACIATCPWHGWQFDVTNGQSQLSPHVRQPTIQIKVEVNRVLVACD